MMQNLYRITFSLFLLVICAASTNSQTVPETPEQFAERYMTATVAKDWATITQMIHPEAHERFKKIFAEIIAADKTMGVAKFFNVRNKQEFDALPAETVLERMMRNLTRNEPTVGEALTNLRTRIIGHVKEEADLAYVVYRTETNIGGATFSKLAILPLKKDKGAWLALLTGDMENLAQIFQQKQNTTSPKPKAASSKRSD
ncbi:MAG: hypothetical protein M3209_05760 [Acidobacteriota bacterium]|nr:hypothetical protein [Acidobacteriota bacterium]